MVGIVVLGSVNRDVVAEVDALPGTGETVTAREVRHGVGGKGANQAVAARLLGAEVNFVARVGDDEVAGWLRDGLCEVGLDPAGVRAVPGRRSGAAYIAVAGGENTIIVDPGANHAWPDGLGADSGTVAEAELLVLQNEIPTEVNELAAGLASGRVVLNAAPDRPVPPTLLARCDPLVVNEHELAGQVAGAAMADVRTAMRALLDRGALGVVTTLGAAGAAWCTPDGFGQVAAPKVTATDSTGAGDAFVGALAGELAAGAELQKAIRWAVAVASASVRAAGTHTSYPDRKTVRALLDEVEPA